MLLEAAFKHSIIYLLFQVPKEYPFNNLYLERGGDPNKDPSEEKHTSNKIISNNVYGC